MSEEITAAAVRILGTEEELLPALCTAAEAGLRARLRRDVDPEKECRECFVMAAALVAASTLLSAQAQGVTGVAQKHVKGNAGHIRGGEGPQGQLHEAPFISGEPVQLPLGGPAGFAQILLCRLPALPGKAADVIT